MRIKRSVFIEAPGLGERIEAARRADNRSLTEICKLAGLSRDRWYGIEKEQVEEALPEETFLRIQAALGVNLGVNFDSKK